MAGDGTTTPGNFSSQLLGRLGLPTTSVWQSVVDAWLRAESGSPSSGNPGWKYNNPLNTECLDSDTFKTGCWATRTGRKFAIYPNLDAAVGAYTSGHFLHGGSYTGILSATSPLALANAITASPWDAGHYAQYHSGQNTGIAALAFGMAGTGAGGSFAGGNLAQGNVGAYQGGGNILSQITGIPGAILGGVVGFFGGAIETTVINIAALLLGFIFVIIGLVMFLKGTDKPTEAVRTMANTGFEAGLAAAVPAYAGRAGGARGFGRAAGNAMRSRSAAAEAAGTIPVGTAMGMGNRARARHAGRGSGAGIRVEEPPSAASYSSETPRSLVVLPVLDRREVRKRVVKNVTPKEGRLASGQRQVAAGG